MLDEKTKRALKEQWIEEGEPYEGYGYIKIVGVSQHRNWAVFIYAMNPRDETEVKTLWRDGSLYYLSQTNLNELMQMHGDDGEFVYQDMYYKPRKLRTLIQDIARY